VSIPLWVLGPSLLVRAKRAVEIGNGSNGPKADMENCPAVVTRVGTSSKAQPRPRVSSADAISATCRNPLSSGLWVFRVAKGPCVTYAITAKARTQGLRTFYNLMGRPLRQARVCVSSSHGYHVSVQSAADCGGCCRSDSASKDYRKPACVSAVGRGQVD
jgi:hypothetical protein